MDGSGSGDAGGGELLGDYGGFLDISTQIRGGEGKEEEDVPAEIENAGTDPDSEPASDRPLGLGGGSARVARRASAAQVPHPPQQQRLRDKSGQGVDLIHRAGGRGRA